jgi:hypothetical protein
MDVLGNPQCYELTVEDPSFEFETMRDIYDLKLLLKSGFFSVFEDKLPHLGEDLITRDNYGDFRLSKSEVEQIQKRLKLTKSRVRM